MFFVHSHCVYLLHSQIKHIKQIIKYFEAKYSSKHTGTVSAALSHAGFGFETDITYLAGIHVKYKGTRCIRLMFLGLFVLGLDHIITKHKWVCATAKKLCQFGADLFVARDSKIGFEKHAFST